MGVAVGVGIALVLARFLGSLLYGVSAHDVATFAAASVVLMAVAAIATLVPAWRASRVDPMLALREH